MRLYPSPRRRWRLSSLVRARLLEVCAVGAGGADAGVVVAVAGSTDPAWLWSEWNACLLVIEFADLVMLVR